MSDTATTLYARPSFIEGVARILDFGNTLSEYNRARTPQEADSEAFASDTSAVSADFREAIEQVRKELSLISS